MNWRLVGTAAFIATAALMFATVGDYGITWDEEVQSIYGEHVLAWFASGFRNDAALAYLNLHLYAAFFDVVAQLFARLSPLDLYTDRHIVNVAFMLLGLAGTWRLGTLVLGERGGVMAMLFVVLTPMFYGHGFNNPKDIPFAALVVWTLCFLLETTRTLPVISVSAVAKLTVVFGTLLAIRPGGIFVFGYIVLWWLVSTLRAGCSVRTAVLRSALPLAIVLLGAWLIMLSFWPWGQVSPILNPLRGMKNAARFSFTATTLYFGQQVPARHAPIGYLPTWLALQLPETYFVAAVAAIVAAAARRRWRIVNKDGLQTAITLAFLAFVVLFPMAAAILLRSTLYDALRHFLFVLPPLAVLASAAIERALRAPVPRPARAAIAIALVTATTVTAWDMVLLHPYESVYFNRVVAGGLAGAAGRFETDYWGNSYKDAVEWVVKNVPGQDIRIANCSNRLQSSYYLRGAGTRFVPVGLKEQPDILLATTRWDCHRRPGARVLHTVDRQGVPLVYVLDLRRKNPL